MENAIGAPHRFGHLHRSASWLALLPGLLAALLALAFAAYLLLTRDEVETQRSNQLEQDLLWQKQAIEQQLRADIDALFGLAATLYTGIDFTMPLFQARTLSLTQSSPEIVGLTIEDGHGQILWRAAQARQALPFNGQTGWGDEIVQQERVPLLQYAVPTPDRQHFVVATIALDRLLQQQVPWWIAQRYQIALIDARQRLITAKSQRQLDPSGVFKNVALETPPLKLSLRAEVYHATSPRSFTDDLPWLLFALSAAILITTRLLQNHMRQHANAVVQLRSEIALREAMENSLITGMLAMDLTGRVIYVNCAFCNMVGFSETELLGYQAMPYWPPEEMERCQATSDAILAGQLDPNGFAVRFMHKNSERFDVRVYASKLIDGEGKQIGWMASLYDITEIRRERQALQASHERFVTVLNGLDAVVAVSDAQSGELLMSNHQFDRAFDLPDWRGRCCIIPFVPRRAELPIDAEWFDSFREHWYQIKSRQSVWVDGSAVWLEIATDITTLKTAAARERRQNETLQQTARLISIGEMASSLAHELNQPLGAIASYASGCHNLLAAPQPNLYQLSQAIEKMGEQAKRAGQIIRGIREFIQRRAPHRKCCEIDILLDTVLGLLGHEISRRGVRVILHQEQALPTLYADPVMLEQVIFNLIKNALEAMEATPPTQRMLKIDLARDGNQLRVSIEDRGAGIAPEQLEQLFKPFFTTKDNGMGMGLNICRSIIEHHRGRLWVQTNHSGGSCFIFTVPFDKENKETDALES